MVRTKSRGGVGESWSDELELELGGYSRVEHVERVENAEPRQICRGSAT